MLSLYLLLLAFFVVLHNNSRAHDAKAKAVAGSLHASFAGKGTEGDRPVPDSTPLGGALVEARFRSMVGHVVKTHIALAEVEVVGRGRFLRARLPVSAVFLDGGASIRPGLSTLLRRIAEELADRPDGTRYDLEVFIASAWITPAMLRERSPLEIDRADAIARALLRAGAPTNAVSVGLRQGRPAWIVMDFHVRAEGERRPAPKISGVGEGVR